MSNKFNGFWATYEYLDDFCNVMKELRESGQKELSTHSPCPRHEIEHVLADPPSRVPFFTLISGLIGAATAYIMAGWMNLDWVLPVSGKTILSIPPFTVIAFELTVLLGAYGTMIGVVLSSLKDIKARSFPKSQEYINYPRFTRDRFGLIVRCVEADASKVEKVLNKYQAEEIHREN